MTAEPLDPKRPRRNGAPLDWCRLESDECAGPRALQYPDPWGFRCDTHRPSDDELGVDAA